MTDSAVANELLVEQRGPALWLTIHREERRNAMSHTVLAGMAEAITAAQTDRSVRAIVITGTGTKAFCAGADLQSAKAFTTDYSEPHGHLAQLLRVAKASNVPLIARVNGACMAGGMGLLSMCDMAVAARHAVFGLPEVKVGVFPAQVLSVLQHLIPRRKLAEMCLTGEPLTSEQALEFNLVNYVDDDVDAKLQWLLDRLLDKAPAAIRRGLYTMKKIEAMAFEESMSFTESQIALFTLTEDAKEGQKAFQEKRKPGVEGTLSMKTIRIGGASGFWGDSSVGAPQLVQHGNIDYLVFDYLAELTMSILAAARGKNPELGYATDFVAVTMKTILKDVVAKNIRVISNAGGVNPQACASAIQALAAEQGLAVKIAVVQGDDVTPLLPQLRSEDVRELQSGAALPEKVLTANAYLGALPVKAALDAGAQIVITGRCVDSAVTLGALMHAFGWSHDDYDRLAQGSLAGHIIECGCQATGGLHTDWEDVPDWPHIGYPVIECSADGSFVATKPPGTGGLVNTAVISEQMLYEIGDPRRYLLPDVTCDFTQVRLQQVGEHRVDVRGARGLAPGPAYKVSSTYLDGFRCNAQLTIVGIDAAKKARRTGEAVLTRTRELFAALGLADYTRTHIEVLGSEAGNFGPHARTAQVREAVLHLAVMHPQKAALEVFAREIAPAGTSWSPGTTGAAGRPSPSPAIKQFAFLLDKARLQPVVTMQGQAWNVDVPVTVAAEMPDTTTGHTAAQAPATSASSGKLESDPHSEVPLIALAWARSGDKGDSSNIGVIARRPEWLPLLRAQLTDARVAQWLGHLVQGEVTRFDLPGIHAMNFLCTRALDGGGMASLRNDPLGKGMAQILLTMPITVPRNRPDPA